MRMIPVTSSDIESIGYENGTLYISFNSGGVYSYGGVPESVYKSFMSAPSHGRFFHMYIKNKYPYEKIG